VKQANGVFGQVIAKTAQLKRFNNLLCALSFSELHREFPFCLRIIEPFYAKIVDTPAQQSVKQANGAFGQVIVKTAQEFGLSLLKTMRMRQMQWRLSCLLSQ